MVIYKRNTRATLASFANDLGLTASEAMIAIVILGVLGIATFVADLALRH